MTEREEESLERAYLEFLRALRTFQFDEDAYSQGALNGQFYLQRVERWEPTFRKTLADVLAFHGAVQHKLHWMQRIVDYGQRRGAPIGADVMPRLNSRQGLRSEKAAERYYRLALELDPDCARALYNLGSLLAERGDVDAAIGHLDRAALVQSHYLPYADLRAASLLQSAGRKAQAAERWKKLAARPYNFGQKQYWLAIGLRAAGDIDAALSEIDRCLECHHYYAPEFSELRLPEPAFPPKPSPSPGA
jgi:tetratricopeptide (TPR) repeat protein